MKTRKTVGGRLLCLLLILSLCLSLASCVRLSLPGVTDPERVRLRCMTTTTVTEWSGRTQTNVQRAEYDGDGLITRYTVNYGEEKTDCVPVYTRNERGDPTGCSVQAEGEAYSCVIGNRYENGELVEALITDVQFIGASMRENGGPDLSSSIQCMLLSGILQFLQSYRGYRNCSLRIDGTDFAVIYRDGRIVSYVIQNPDTREETLTEYSEDGSVRTTQKNYRLQNGAPVLQGSSSILYSAEHCELENRFSGSTGEEICLQYRFEDSTDPATGERLRLAYISRIDSPAAAEAFQKLKQLEDQPVARYMLDARGRVLRSEQTEIWQELVGGRRKTLWYDEAGREVKQEISVRSGDYSSDTTIEWEYAP